MQDGTQTEPAPIPSGARTLALPPTPLAWRIALLLGVGLLVALAYLGESWLGPRGRSALGVCCFLGVAGVFSQRVDRAQTVRGVLGV